VAKNLVRGIVLVSSLLLAACGSDSTDTPASTPSSSASINSSAVKGVIDNGRVVASRWQEGAWTQVASTLTNEAGDFSLNLQDAQPGILRLELLLSDNPAEATRMRCDAPAGCGTAVFGEWQELAIAPALVSWARVESSGAVAVMPLTPLSTLVVRYAESISGVLSNASLSFAQERVARMLGVSSSVLMARPGDITSTTFVAAASADAMQVTLLSAAFAQMAAGGDLNQVLNDFVAGLIENNGRLQQEGDVSLSHLLTSASEVGAQVDVDASRLRVAEWQSRIAALVSGQLSPLNSIALNTSVFVTDLGALGVDVAKVIRDSGAFNLEHLMVKELSEFGWLLGTDSQAVAEVAIQTVAYAALGSVYLDALPPSINSTPLASGDLTAVLNRKTETTPNQLLLTGTYKGLQVDLTIDLTSFKEGAANKLFVYKAVGALGNAVIKADIDGTLSIDPKDTDLQPLLAGIQSIVSGNGDTNVLVNAVSGLLANGHGVFALDGSAGMKNLSNNSELSVAGKASAELTMDGADNDGVLVNGGIAYGDLVLPNGDSYRITRGSDEHLTFSLDGTGDGQLSAKFLATILTVPQARVIATGSLTKAGLFISHARDEAVNLLGQITSGASVNLADTLAALTNFDFTSMNLIVDGKAVVDGWSKSYRLAVRNGDIKVYQPNSDTSVAMTLNFGRQGLFVQTTSRFWLIGVDFANPALVVADATGGESRYSFDALLGYLAFR